MARDFILGTAGHIDHGKTSLVQALTGINCDRLPEEKQRGITIDIGFAQLDLGEFHLGIVDVPGHERFVKNMLAGATGFDLALLIIAADDSIMPQTREHLEILSLLGLKHGVIAMTKVDTVDETTKEVVELEIREFVKGTFLEIAPIMPTSAKSGQGIDELKQTLKNICQNISQSIEQQSFRLAIDRSFVVQGHGTIVTGSIASGTIQVGQALDWLKTNGEIETVRVRSLNNHGQAVESLQRGQRAAINLAGVPHDQVHRGQEICTPGFLKSSKVVTVRIHALPQTRHPLKHRLPCRLHIGTAEVMASLSVLDADRVDPGSWALAQFFTEEPIAAIWGQPFVVRDASAQHTLGGGNILQPDAIKLRRRHIDSLQRIEKLWTDNDEVKAAEATWFAGFSGLNQSDWPRLTGISIGRQQTVFEKLVADKIITEWIVSGNKTRLIHTDRSKEIETQILSAINVLHKEFPLHTAHDRGKIIAALDYIDDHDFIQAAMDRMLKAKLLVGDQRKVASAEFKPKLSINQRKLKDKIVAEHQAGGLTPPESASFANQVAGNMKALNEIYEVAVAEGLLVKINQDIHLASEVEVELKKKVSERLANGATATVAEIRDILGTTRKYAVPICEYLDKIGLTKRNGDVRVLTEKQLEFSN